MRIALVLSTMSVARTRCPNCGFEVQGEQECPLCGAELAGEVDEQTENG
ncbi:hypothetical protein HSR122_1749 [Halapricum desulfuricans]|nr:hypothetical protein HSR122_1749 [Halapricum desulfuricans]